MITPVFHPVLPIYCISGCSAKTAHLSKITDCSHSLSEQSFPTISQRALALVPGQLVHGFNGQRSMFLIDS